MLIVRMLRVFFKSSFLGIILKKNHRLDTYFEKKSRGKHFSQDFISNNLFFSVIKNNFSVLSYCFLVCLNFFFNLNPGFSPMIWSIIKSSWQCKRKHKISSFLLIAHSGVSPTRKINTCSKHRTVLYFGRTDANGWYRIRIIKEICHSRKYVGPKSLMFRPLSLCAHLYAFRWSISPCVPSTSVHSYLISGKLQLWGILHCYFPR